MPTRSHRCPGELTSPAASGGGALAALAVLAICAAETVKDYTQPDTIRLSIAEIRRLINTLILHPAGSTAHCLHWSDWRLHHQARAKRAHYARRLSLEFPP